MSDANEWSYGAAKLHMRAALKDAATDCGQADSIDGIFIALRARFGMTASQARAKIISLKRDSRTALQEHAAEVTRLVNLAYEELSGDQRRNMAKDMFLTTIGNAYLHRHLLAVRAESLEDAVRAGNKYLQVQQPRIPGAAIRGIQQEDEEMDEIREVSTKPEVTDPMQQLVQSIGKLVDQMAKWTGPQEKTTPTGRTTPTEERTVICFGCGRAGHTRRDCYANEWNSQRRNTKNVSSPQQ